MRLQIKAHNCACPLYSYPPYSGSNVTCRFIKLVERMITRIKVAAKSIL